MLTSEYSSRWACSLSAFEGREHPPQRGDLVVAGVLGDQARGHAFQRRPGGDHLDHLAPGLAHDVDAAARHRAHEALALELRHRLAHRRAADAEVLRELALVEPDVGAAAVDVHRHDDVLQRGVGLVLEAEGGVDRLDRQPRRVSASARGRGGDGVTQGTEVGHLEYNIPRDPAGATPVNAVMQPVARYCEARGAILRGQVAARGARNRENPLLDHRPEQRDQAERHDGADQPVGQEHRQAALRGQQRLAESFLRLVAQHDRQHHRRQRIVASSSAVAGDAEHQHHHHVEADCCARCRRRSRRSPG